MSKKEEYEQQVRLLVSILPIIDKEEIFALKGGTAINLFYRPFPRLSVDIDLLYLPMDDRETAWQNIKEAFSKMTRLGSLSAWAMCALRLSCLL